jgi:hypothetical protein
MRSLSFFKHHLHKGLSSAQSHLRGEQLPHEHEGLHSHWEGGHVHETEQLLGVAVHEGLHFLNELSKQSWSGCEFAVQHLEA